MLVPVQNNVSLKRETASGAVLNTDMAAYMNIRQQKEARMDRESRIQQELDELKRIVQLLMESRNGSN